MQISPIECEICTYFVDELIVNVGTVVAQLPKLSENQWSLILIHSFYLSLFIHATRHVVLFSTTNIYRNFRPHIYVTTNLIVIIKTHFSLSKNCQVVTLFLQVTSLTR